MRQADPVVLAAELFGAGFDGASLLAPVRPVRRIDEAIHELSGTKQTLGAAATWLGLAMPSSPTLQPYLMESVVIWQLSRVAALRTWGGQTAATTVTLLPRGAGMLSSVSPVALLRDWRRTTRPPLRVRTRRVATLGAEFSGGSA